jgi:hypothetical protein
LPFYWKKARIKSIPAEKETEGQTFKIRLRGFKNESDKGMTRRLRTEFRKVFCYIMSGGNGDVFCDKRTCWEWSHKGDTGMAG